jgi:hypothetical protein
MALHQITVAAVMPADVDRIRLFFEELEDFLDESESDECAVGEWLVANYCRIRYDWSRLLFAYETMYANACDPTVRHLEWKPEIKAALELAAAAKED